MYKTVWTQPATTAILSTKFSCVKRQYQLIMYRALSFESFGSKLVLDLNYR